MKKILYRQLLLALALGVIFSANCLHAGDSNEDPRYIALRAAVTTINKLSNTDRQVTPKEVDDANDNLAACFSNAALPKKNHPIWWADAVAANAKMTALLQKQRAPNINSVVITVSEE
jgi:hypothetical protein